MTNFHLDPENAKLKFTIIKDGQIVPVADVIEWAIWLESHDEERMIAQTDIGNSHVSTVFLGLDHNPMSALTGRPLYLETMVFGGPMDMQKQRYSTIEEAKAGHLEMCEKVRALILQRN